MEEDEYAQDFEEEDPEEAPANIKAGWKAEVTAPRSKIQSQRKITGHPIIRVLRELSQDKPKAHWPSQSTKTIEQVAVALDEQPESDNRERNEEELKRAIYQLQIRIKSLQKAVEQRQEQLEQEQLESVQRTQHSVQTHSTSKPLKRAFNREEQVKFLLAHRHTLQQELQQQHNKILSLKNREMELQSTQYLVDLTKQVDHYQTYLKKLAKYVHHQRLQLERKQSPAVQTKRVGHSDKSVQSVLLHNEISIERLEEKAADLDDRIADLQQNHRYLDEKLAELAREQPQQPNQNSLEYKELLHRKMVEQRNLKTVKASIRNKMLILHSESDELTRQKKHLERQLAERSAAERKMLERLKQQAEQTSNQEVLSLAGYLIDKLERTSKGKTEPLSQDITSSRVSTIDEDHTFTSGVIRLKRRLAAVHRNHQQPSFDEMYAAASSHLITHLPSLNTTNNSRRSSPRTTRRRTSSQLSVTTNDEQQHSSKLVRFSYW